MSVAVVVMGDLGRSPRMLNHVEMLLKHTQFEVDLVGCPGTDIRRELTYRYSERLRVRTVSSKFVDRLKRLPKALFLVYAAMRILIETLQLILIFAFMKKPRLALIQNPPNLPVLAVLLLVSRLRQFPVCIDWHNYGFSILRVAHRPSWMVNAAEIYERTVGAIADLHICVSDNLKADLATYSIKAKTLYDLPTSHFKPVTDLTQVIRLKDLLKIDPKACLVVSSTSWTPDEDFGILLEAIDLLDRSIKTPICFVITGKGPMKEFYTAEIGKKKWDNCSVKLAWLEAEDYPVLLGAADIGVCLHTSSSKLDLPMKVVDMHGAGLPVLAYAYPTIGELVTRETGDVFVDSSDLADKLKVFIESPRLLSSCRSELIKKRRLGTWETEWNRVFVPLLQTHSSNSALTLAFRSLLAIVLVKLVVSAW